MSSVSRANGDLTELLCIRVRSNRTVGKHEDTLLAISLCSLVFENHDECARDARDARSCLDDLKCRTKHVASSVASTCHLTVSLSALDDERTEVERILDEFCCFLWCHALLLTELEEEVGILLCVRVVFRLNDCSLVDILETIFGNESIDFRLCADEHDICDTITEDAVCCLDCTRFCAFCKDNALLVGLSLSNELIH